MAAKKKMNKGLKVFLIILFALALVFAGFYVLITWDMDKVKTTEVSAIDISTIPDGTYTGVFSGNRWANTLEVTVSGGAVTDIKILKDQMVKGKNVAADVFKQVVENQSLKVDAVSGATVTTKGYLLAIEDALKK